MVSISRVSISRIATEAGVSKMTVSNVLNGRIKEVWPSTVKRADRIRRIAKQLGYRPNAAARAVSTGKFHSVALLQTTRVNANHLTDLLINGIHDALAEREMNLLFARVTDEQLCKPEFVPSVLRQFMADALLINYRSDVPEYFKDLVERERTPATWLGVKRSTDAVYHDEAGAARRATERLLNLGHRRIAYVDYRFGPKPNPTLNYHIFDRREGYRMAMEAAGLPPWFIFSSQALPDEGHLDSENWMQESRRWLASTDRPTAVLAYKIPVALPIYVAAMNLGLRVPGDLSIIGIDSWHQKLGIHMGMMWIPDYEIGHAAGKMVLRKLEDRTERLCPSVALASSLDPGQTVGPPE